MEQAAAYEFLLTLLNQEYFHGQWQTEWYEFNHYFELRIQCPLTNYECSSLSDIYRTKVNEEIFFYEFSVIFYDSDVIVMDKVDAIQTFPINPTNGICQGDMFAIVKYLKQLSASVRIHWEEYLFHPQDEGFEIVWDQTEFERIKQNLIKNYQYSHGKLYFSQV